MEYTTRRSYANEPDGDDGKPSRIALDNMPEGRAVQEKEMTGTEMLMKLMAEWHRDGEPQEVIVVFLDKELSANYRMNCPHTRALGLAHFAVMGSEEAMRNESYEPTPKTKETTQ